MKSAIYIRVTESGPSVEEQRAECTLLIASKGWTLMREFVDAETFTGKPGSAYGELLTDMRKGRIECVVAYTAERMFRGMRGMIQLFEHARVGNAKFFLCREGVSTQGVQGSELVRAAKMVFEIDIKRRAEVSSLVQRRLKMSGRQPGRPRKHNPALEGVVDTMLSEGVPVCTIARNLNIGRGFVRIRARDRAMEENNVAP